MCIVDVFYRKKESRVGKKVEKGGIGKSMIDVGSH